jgi:hypothetical protein
MRGGRVGNEKIDERLGALWSCREEHPAFWGGGFWHLRHKAPPVLGPSCFVTPEMYPTIETVTLPSDPSSAKHGLRTFARRFMICSRAPPSASLPLLNREQGRIIEFSAVILCSPMQDLSGEPPQASIYTVGSVNPRWKRSRRFQAHNLRETSDKSSSTCDSTFPPQSTVTRGLR